MVNIDPTSLPGAHIALRVGITGGIGSGKSTVGQIFQALGIPVYDADRRAKWLIQHAAALKQGILEIFGEEAYLPDGSYNRPRVAAIAFAQPDQLAALNALVHPAVERDSRDWHREQVAAGAPYTLKEAALLIESGSHRWLDALIVVTAPEALRIERVMQRDGLTADQVQARLANQLAEADRLLLANHVIINDGQYLLLPQVLAIHRLLLASRVSGRNIS